MVSCELVIMCSGALGGARLAAVRMARSSPEFLELRSGGTGMAVLRRSSCAYQRPLPVFGSAELRSMYAPATWTVIGGDGGMGSHARRAGDGWRSLSFTKMWKA